MAKLQHTFIQGKMNKDLDERLVPNGQYRDAQNIQVSTSEGSDVGAVENILGNTKKNLRSTGPDVFWQDNFGLQNPVCIGVVKDSQNEKIYWFLNSADSSTDAIVEYDQTTGIVAPILVDVNGVLNFNKLNLITGVNILEGLLFFTDDISEPKVIDIAKFKTGSSNFTTQTQINSQNFIESDVTVIKLSPKQAVSIEVLPSLVSTTSNRGTGVTPIFISANLGQASPLTGSLPIGATFTITGGFSGFLAPGSVFLNKQVTLSAKALQEDGSYLYYEAICTITALTAGEQPNEFDGGTFRIDSISADVPYNYLNWSVLLLESDPIFKNNFPRFSYRYKYSNNEYSTYAPFSEAAYVPGQFDYEAAIGFNKGMTNNLRKITLTFPTDTYALPPAGVEEIQILFKGSGSNNIYVIDNHLLSSGALTTFDITSELLGPVVESIQLLRPFDAVPRKAKSQEIIGNRVVYGNYLQNYTIGSIPVLTAGQTNTSFTAGEEYLGKKSIKSNRTYQLGITFIDEYNRESPVFTNNNASVIIAENNSSKKNALTASATLASVPSWIKYYKYYIKDPANEYYNIVLDRWYDSEDGNAWLSFASSDVNKLREDQYIILKKQHGTSTAVSINNRYKILDIQNEAPRHIKMEQTEVSSAQITAITNGFTAAGPFIGFQGPTFVENNNFHEGFNGNSAIQFIEEGATANAGGRVSQLYEIANGGPQNDSGGKTNYSVSFNSGSGIIPADDWLTGITSGTLKAVLYNLEESTRPEFQGRFFVKVPKNSDFINNIEAPSSTSVIQGGFNAAVRAGSRNNSVSTDMTVNPSVNADRLSFGDTNNSSVAINRPDQGATTFTLVYGPVSNTNPGGVGGKQNFNVYSLASSPFAKIRFVGSNNNFSEVYNITNNGTQQSYNRNGLTFVYRTFTVDRPFVGEFGVQATTITKIEIVSDSIPDHFTTPNPAIFETEPNELADLDIYYEASGAKLISGLSNTVTLDYFNSYSFGNGVESNRREDDFNAPMIGKGVRVSSVLDTPFKEERRSAGLIFSGIFNSTSGINNTNQFTLAENITKDLNPTYGSIQKLHARDTDLIALLEDKCFKILANKDALFNADGNTNVTSNANVLGQTIPFVGEYGISKNPESFASFGFRAYFTDKARGAVMRLSRDGLTDISDKGMSYFFQDGLKTNVNPNIIGAYDSDAGSYNVVVGGEGVSFKEKSDGWNTRLSYDPEAGISLNNEYYTFKNAELYEHSNTNRSNFYGVQGDTTVTPIFNDAPTSVKNFKTLSYEGDEGWTASVTTNKQSGTVSTWKEREGIYFNYISGDGTFFLAELDGAITNSSTIVISAPNTNISVGDTVTGAGILNVVTVTNIAADKITITISSAQTLADETELTFTKVADVDTREFSVMGIGEVLRHDVPYNVIIVNGEINVSLQPGDIILTNDSNNVLQVVGTVLSVNRAANTITLTASGAVILPTAPPAFILFTKNTEANTSGLLGYYSEAVLSTSSSNKKELFAVNSEIFISSE